MLTTPMMEESKWTSQRRRSSAALRMRSLESESLSFFAISEISIFCFCFLEVKKENEIGMLVFFILLCFLGFEYSRARCLPGNIFRLALR